eukprot:COSAG03_NODE_50_length_16299_cov_20.189877_2_plen_169_part_00
MRSHCRIADPRRSGERCPARQPVVLARTGPRGIWINHNAVSTGETTVGSEAAFDRARDTNATETLERAAYKVYISWNTVIKKKLLLTHLASASTCPPSVKFEPSPAFVLASSSSEASAAVTARIAAGTKSFCAAISEPVKAASLSTVAAAAHAALRVARHCASSSGLW